MQTHKTLLQFLSFFFSLSLFHFFFSVFFFFNTICVLTTKARLYIFLDVLLTSHIMYKCLSVLHLRKDSVLFVIVTLEDSFCLPECIIWLDNVDGLCDSADELKSCEDFLNEITTLLHKEDASQVSFYQ